MNFTFNDDKIVRTVEKDGQAWFVVADICQGIGIKNTTHAVQSLDSDEKGMHSMHTLGSQDLLIVSEAGLYKIMLRSRGATTPGTVAHAFTRWVTHEVLPSIRQTGSYSVSQRLANETSELNNKSAYAVMSRQIKDAWALRQNFRKKSS